MASSHRETKNQTEFFDFVAHHTRDAIFITASDGQIFFANHAASQLFGYTTEEFLSNGLSLLNDAFRSQMLLSHAKLDTNSTSKVSEWMYDKNSQPLRVKASFARFQVGNLDRIAIVMWEADHERGLTHTSKASDAFTENTPVMIYVADSDWRILWANDNKAVGSGYSIPELVGQQSPLRQYLAEEEPHTLATIERELDKKGEWSGELYSRRKNRQVYPLWASISVVDGFQPGKRHRIVMLTDLSAAQGTERIYRYLSRYDFTTTLPNRAFFDEHTKNALARANPEKDPLYILLLDIDRFSKINEVLGYSAGDQVLTRISYRLREAVGSWGFLSRHTGDTFSILATGSPTPQDIAKLVDRIRQVLHSPLELDDHTFHLSVSIGISCYPVDGKTSEELLRAADVALQRARKEGGNSYAFYQAGTEAASRQFIELATPIQKGLRNNEFSAYFQPIVDSRTWKTVSMEALARWQRQDGTWTSPNAFIPVAEQSGDIGDIFEAVLRQTCLALDVFDGSQAGAIGASVNISAQQILDHSLPVKIIESIRYHKIDPSRISLEITESILMDHPEDKARILEALQREGIKIVIDDFGTGYSSFAYLKRFHVDGIKLDRLFVNDIPGNIKDEKLVEMILAMGNELDIPIVAEGVETHPQAEFLLGKGCPRLQGYLIAPPLSLEDFRTFLANS